MLAGRPVDSELKLVGLTALPAEFLREEFLAVGFEPQAAFVVVELSFDIGFVSRQVEDELIAAGVLRLEVNRVRGRLVVRQA